MTPAIELLKKHNINFVVCTYEHEKNCDSFGLEAAQKLDLDETDVYKTLVAQTNDGEHIVALVAVCDQLNLKKLALSAGAKKASMANPQQVQSKTGYLIGGVSPIAQKRDLRTFIDIKAQTKSFIYVSGGKRGVDIKISPHDLAAICRASFTELAL